MWEVEDDGMHIVCKPPKNILETLEAAKETILRGWTQNVLLRDKYGAEVNRFMDERTSWREDVASVCAYGALLYVNGPYEHAARIALELACGELYGHRHPDWINDGRDTWPKWKWVARRRVLKIYNHAIATQRALTIRKRIAAEDILDTFAH